VQSVLMSGESFM